MSSSLNKILLLGDPRLYQISNPVEKDELPGLLPEINEMFELILLFRKKYVAGRAIAAPQIGIHKRIICFNIDRPIAIINPVVSEFSDDMFEVWDDCMCFPNLLVKVLRHKSCTLEFFDLTWEKQTWYLKNDLSELIQHEYDHLNGILAVKRAIDDRSFRWRK